MSTRATVAILGANGFIGSRLVENLVLADLAEVRPIVRSFNGMVRSARFDLDCRVADGTDASSLQPHLNGCDILFNCVTGEGSTIVKNSEAAYRAAAGAGVRRLVHLSSAVVHGNSPVAGTQEESELLSDQPFEYNVNKVLAENLIWQLSQNRAVEVVVLRPFIVYGPRSITWTARIASELMRGRAYLVDGGTGICNTVFIDNLVHALWLAAVSPRAANEAFFVTDGERVTWRDLYQALAEAVGTDLSKIHRVDKAVLKNIPRRSDNRFWNSVIRQSGSVAKQLLPPAAKWLGKKILPRKLTSNMRQAWETAHEPSNGMRPPTYGSPQLPSVDLQIASLQDCRYMLPITKAQRILEYVPQVSFATGCIKAASWLQFALGFKDTDMAGRKVIAVSKSPDSV
jgi:nucleoside-diphosphate-sugar epimerase